MDSVQRTFKYFEHTIFEGTLKVWDYMFREIIRLIDKLVFI